MISECNFLQVRKMADETGLDFTDQINLLESKYQQVVLVVPLLA